MKLTPKQAKFVAEYLVDLNATGAARRAGYSAKTCNEQGNRLLRNVSVRSALTEAMAKRADRTEITADRVLLELGRIAFFDLRKLYREDGSMKPMHELDDEAAAVLAGVDVMEEFDGSGKDRVLIGHTRKAKVPDKVAALALAMRHLGMLKDKLEHSGEIGVRSLAERMRKRVEAK